MNLGWVWPQIKDRASARKAIESGFWACIFIVIVEAAIATYVLVTHEKFAGYYSAAVLVDGVLFAIIAWRLWKNSRIWAVIGLLLMALEIADKIQKAASTFGVITVLLFLAMLNATRGTFALHKYKEAESIPIRTRRRISLDWLWRMPDKASARTAIRCGCWAFVFLSMIFLLWGTYILATGQPLAGWGARGSGFLFVMGLFYLVVAWRLWRNSRAWALLGLIVMGAGFAAAEISLVKPNGFFVFPLILFLAMTNAARGAFAFQKYSAQEQMFVGGPPPEHAGADRKN